MSFKQSDIDRIVLSSDNINFDVSTVGLAKTEVFVDRGVCVGYNGYMFFDPIVGGSYGANH